MDGSNTRPSTGAWGLTWRAGRRLAGGFGVPCRRREAWGLGRVRGVGVAPSAGGVHERATRARPSGGWRQRPSNAGGVAGAGRAPQSAELRSVCSSRPFGVGSGGDQRGRYRRPGASMPIARPLLKRFDQAPSGAVAARPEPRSAPRNDVPSRCATSGRYLRRAFAAASPSSYRRDAAMLVRRRCFRTRQPGEHRRLCTPCGQSRLSGTGLGAPDRCYCRVALAIVRCRAGERTKAVAPSGGGARSHLGDSASGHRPGGDRILTSAFPESARRATRLAPRRDSSTAGACLPLIASVRMNMAALAKPSPSRRTGAAGGRALRCQVSRPSGAGRRVRTIVAVVAAAPSRCRKSSGTHASAGTPKQ